MSVKVTEHRAVRYVRYSFLSVWNSSFVFKIFRLQKCRDLEIRVRSHLRSLNVVPLDRLCMISYWCSLVTLSLKRTIFEIIDFKNADTLKTGVGSIKFIGMSPFDRAHTTSYWRSIVTMALSRVVSEIFNVEKCRDLEIRHFWNPGQKSLKVIESGTIR